MSGALVSNSQIENINNRNLWRHTVLTDLFATTHKRHATVLHKISIDLRYVPKGGSRRMKTCTTNCVVVACLHSRTQSYSHGHCQADRQKPETRGLRRGSGWVSQLGKYQVNHGLCGRQSHGQQAGHCDQKKRSIRYFLSRCCCYDQKKKLTTEYNTLPNKRLLIGDTSCHARKLKG